MPFQVERLDHVELWVRDPEDAAAWYRETLGLEEVRRWDPHPIMIGRGGTMLALFFAPEGVEPTPPSFGSFSTVAFLTDEDGFEEAQKHLRALGIAFEGPKDHGAARSVYFNDPDGHSLEITYYVE